jgi:hypothetical protein
MQNESSTSVIFGKTYGAYFIYNEPKDNAVALNNTSTSILHGFHYSVSTHSN